MLTKKAIELVKSLHSRACFSVELRGKRKYRLDFRKDCSELFLGPVFFWAPSDDEALKDIASFFHLRKLTLANFSSFGKSVTRIEGIGKNVKIFPPPKKR